MLRIKESWSYGPSSTCTKFPTIDHFFCIQHSLFCVTPIINSKCKVLTLKTSANKNTLVWNFKMDTAFLCRTHQGSIIIIPFTLNIFSFSFISSLLTLSKYLHYIFYYSNEDFIRFLLMSKSTSPFKSPM